MCIIIIYIDRQNRLHPPEPYRRLYGSGECEKLQMKFGSLQLVELANCDWADVYSVLISRSFHNNTNNKSVILSIRSPFLRVRKIEFPFKLWFCTPKSNTNAVGDAYYASLKPLRRNV